MRAKKCVSILVAASLATTMLTGCPWEKEEDKTDDASSVPVTSTDTSQDDDDSTPSEKPSLTINGSTITAGGNAVTITTANGSYALTLNQSGDTLTITPTPDEKHTTTAVTAEVTSTSQENLSASWSKDEGATRARTLSVRADTQLNLTTSDNGKNFTLTGIPADATSCTINVTFEDLGYVIESDVYKVHDAKGLKAFADEVNGGNESLNCTLTDDINLTEPNWTPIGSYSDYDSNGYTGIFDGDGHTISNLNVNMQTTNNVGLFGYVNGGTVENLNLANVSVSGYYYVGGVVGSNYATITGCYWQEGTGDSPNKGVGNDSGEENCKKVENGDWSSDNLPEGFKLVGGKPVPVNIKTSTGNTVVDTVLDTARMFGMFGL